MADQQTVLIAGAFGLIGQAAVIERNSAMLRNLMEPLFDWQHAWAAIAEALGMTVGEHRPVRLVEELLERSPQRAAIVDRHGLSASRDIIDFVGYNSLVYTDQLLAGHDAAEGPVLNSTIAVRQAGFTECMDTEDMFRNIFRRLRDGRVLP